MKTFARLAALLVAFAAVPAFAAITCSVMVTSITTVYDPTVATENISTGSYTISCTRLASDASTLNWSLGADNGNHASGAQNRVQLGTRTYNYEIYRLTPYINANRWQDATATRFSGTINFGGALIASASGSFDLRVPGNQTVRPAGTYSDTVDVTLRNSTTLATLSTSSFNVSVITTDACQINVPPGAINFTYASFQAAVANASTSFGVRCTDALPYTMALDAFPGPLLGLTYSLVLSQTNATGNGVTQTYSINGSIAAGQAGTCATGTCSGSQTRTLTVTY
jgi:spore coat protein U-like protein